jgi:CubicO group peptidase (beta-lactamase class C family)
MMERIEKYDIRIDGLAIVRNGAMVFEAYFYPFQKGHTHPIHSCTKSIMSALVGIAIDNGFLAHTDLTVTALFPDNAVSEMDERKRSIRLEHLNASSRL